MTTPYMSKNPYLELQSTNGGIGTRVDRAGSRGLLVDDDSKTGTRNIRKTRRI